jgi:hypothetical protein
MALPWLWWSVNCTRADPAGAVHADAASYCRAGGTRTHDPGITRAMAIPPLVNFRLRYLGFAPQLFPLPTLFDTVSRHDPRHGVRPDRA